MNNGRPMIDYDIAYTSMIVEIKNQYVFKNNNTFHISTFITFIFLLSMVGTHKIGP